MANNLFDHLNNLYIKREPVNLLFKDHFIINRFLALHPLAFWAAADANNLAGKVPVWTINHIHWYGVPRLPKAPFKKYIKAAEKAKLSDKRKAAIKRIEYIFGCSTYHAEQTLTLLEKQGFNIECS